MHDDLNKDEEIDLDPRWLRCFTDDMVNTHGQALSIVNGLHMPILNGMQLFLGTGGPTCYLARGGSSVLDYALAHLDTLCLIRNLKLEDKNRESDHIPLWITLDIWHSGEEERHAPGTTRFQVDSDKKDSYVQPLGMSLAKHMTVTWDTLKDAILGAATIVFKKHGSRHGPHTKGLPHKKRFDEECKQARKKAKQLPHGPSHNEAEKQYCMLTYRKRRQYI